MIKRVLIKCHWFMTTQAGVDFQRLFSFFRGLPRYIIDLWNFAKKYDGDLKICPCLHDRFEKAGATNSEYFWQDLLVAQSIYNANPARHVDIGSRVDGFVAHVASFREIEVFDVRALATEIPGVVFRQCDLMGNASDRFLEYCDSLSCLHAIEHFGLGRYGDTIDPSGHISGINNMSAMLKPGGTFYLSTPIGRSRVEFNANRVFEPLEIIQVVETTGMVLKKLIVIRNGSHVQEIPLAKPELTDLGKDQYNLGIFIFHKTK